MNPQPLEEAFRATVYRVSLPGRHVDLRIGLANAALDDFLRGQGDLCWAVVTACNPGAASLSDEDNRLRHACLMARVRSLGYRFLAALNLADVGAWPPEPGVFLLNVSEAQALALADEFGQLAVVCGDFGSAPRLVWHRCA